MIICCMLSIIHPYVIRLVPMEQSYNIKGAPLAQFVSGRKIGNDPVFKYKDDIASTGIQENKVKQVFNMPQNAKLKSSPNKSVEQKIFNLALPKYANKKVKNHIVSTIAKQIGYNNTNKTTTISKQVNKKIVPKTNQLTFVDHNKQHVTNSNEQKTKKQQPYTTSSKQVVYKNSTNPIVKNNVQHKAPKNAVLPSVYNNNQPPTLNGKPNFDTSTHNAQNSDATKLKDNNKSQSVIDLSQFVFAKKTEGKKRLQGLTQQQNAVKMDYQNTHTNEPAVVAKVIQTVTAAPDRSRDVNTSLGNTKKGIVDKQRHETSNPKITGKSNQHSTMQHITTVTVPTTSLKDVVKSDKQQKYTTTIINNIPKNVSNETIRTAAAQPNNNISLNLTINDKSNESIIELKKLNDSIAQVYKKVQSNDLPGNNMLYICNEDDECHELKKTYTKTGEPIYIVSSDSTAVVPSSLAIKYNQGKDLQYKKSKEPYFTDLSEKLIPDKNVGKDEQDSTETLTERGYKNLDKQTAQVDTTEIQYKANKQPYVEIGSSVHKQVSHTDIPYKDIDRLLTSPTNTVKNKIYVKDNGKIYEISSEDDTAHTHGTFQNNRINNNTRRFDFSLQHGFGNDNAQQFAYAHQSSLDKNVSIHPEFALRSILDDLKFHPDTAAINEPNNNAQNDPVKLVKFSDLLSMNSYDPCCSVFQNKMTKDSRGKFAYCSFIDSGTQSDRGTLLYLSDII